MSQHDAVPEEIFLSRNRREMRLRWTNGHEAAIPAVSLRAACRCAWCTRDRILDRFFFERTAMALVQVEALGTHGLHIKFSDGHERGIYPWSYLVELAGDETAQIEDVATAAR